MNEHIPSEQSLEREARRIREVREQLQRAGLGLVSRLEDYTKAGGDPHATVQSLELFIRAVIQDCLVRLEITR